MIIRRHRRFSIKMQEYENYSFGADVEMSHEDLGITTPEVVVMTQVELTDLRRRLTEAVLAELDEQLIGEVQEVAELTDNKRSFLLKAIRQASAAAKPKPQPPANTNAKPRRVTRHA